VEKKGGHLGIAHGHRRLTWRREKIDGPFKVCGKEGEKKGGRNSLALGGKQLDV